MQYFLDGYRKGDPRIRPAADGRTDDQPDLPGEVDVLIVGTGPAGLLLAAQLSEFPDIVTRVVEKSTRPVGGRPGGRCELQDRRDVRGFRSGRENDRQKPTGSTRPHFWGPIRRTPPASSASGACRTSATGFRNFRTSSSTRPGWGTSFWSTHGTPRAGCKVDYGHEVVALQAPKTDDEPVLVTIRRGGGTADRDHRRSQVRRRLRRCAQHRARVHRPHSAAAQVTTRPGVSWTCWPSPTSPTSGSRHDPVRQRRQHPAHPPRGRLPVAPLRRHG